MRGWNAAFKLTLLYGLLAVLAFCVLFPLLYTLLQSLMTQRQSLQYPPALLPDPISLQNAVNVFSLIPVADFIRNSFVIAGAITAGQVVISSLAAYAFVYLSFPLRKFWFALFLATMMIPWEVTVIPNYLTIKSWDWLDSYQGLIVPFLGSAFGVFLLRQFFMQLPRELFEAAKADGAGPIRHYITIVLPLSRPAIASLSVYVFLTSWNMYLWPLLTTNSSGMRTVQIGIGMLRFEEMVSWNNVLAGVMIVLLPSLLLLALGLKQLVSGITAGAVKG
ncbi:carbohydrate ABC transporter permease [Paenibacillus kobensis]|uniref:carbohydrate ABC transporter permease n=1 Tax=Paenibacillus kobensis TaxID=59841 RepID=UPI000FD7909E|nr:carbohydrate ABC transporter permease [Paenibacillus kobensis]